ncbi:MAG: prephenate dehydratase [Bacillota bacterium]|nr:prephenate dehydratase [Bacillota bacterium]MDI7248905.1 prephenate dehydratase [Bacillota bacterium]
MRVAFQGEPGAFSEEAIWRYWQRWMAQDLSSVQPGASGGAEVRPLPCATVEEVFRAVQEGGAELGVVPVENSYAGSINETSDFLRSFPLYVRGEVILPVRHCLLALPGQHLEEIRRVYSHPQALAQCSGFIRLHALEAVAAADTAGSARFIREQGLAGAGAIAGGRAAEIYGLEILAEGIEDRPDNQTRFFVIGREPLRFAGPAKTTLIMGTAHRPGALYTCLGAFARRGINLTRLESRPSRTRPWEYIFYVDCEGHVDDPVLAEALAELGQLTTYLKVLGSFPPDR